MEIFTKSEDTSRKKPATKVFLFVYRKIVYDVYDVHDDAPLDELGLNPNMAGQFNSTCGFPKNVLSEKRVKPSCFFTFSIILRHMFHKNFIEFAQAVQKILCPY